jgi:hypothetical protein
MRGDWVTRTTRTSPTAPRSSPTHSSCNAWPACGRWVPYVASRSLVVGTPPSAPPSRCLASRRNRSWPPPRWTVWTESTGTPTNCLPGSFDEYTILDANVVAREHYNLPAFRIGPHARLPFTARERADGIADIPANAVSMFRTATKTAALAATCPQRRGNNADPAGCCVTRRPTPAAQRPRRHLWANDSPHEPSSHNDAHRNAIDEALQPLLAVARTLMTGPTGTGDRLSAQTAHHWLVPQARQADGCRRSAHLGLVTAGPPPTRLTLPWTAPAACRNPGMARGG